MKKKTGAAAYANAPVCHQGSYELPVYPAAGVIDELLQLKMIFGHNNSSKYSRFFEMEKRKANAKGNGVSRLTFF